MEHVHSLAEREKQLKDWEATLVAKEMELNGKTTSIKDRERAEAVSNVYEVGHGLKPIFCLTLILHRSSRAQSPSSAMLITFSPTVVRSLRLL